MPTKRRRADGSATLKPHVLVAMAFDFHLHISETSRPGQVIHMLSEESHITPEQAAQQLLEEAARLHAPTEIRQIKVDPGYLQGIKLRSAVRAEARRISGDSVAISRPETPDALIGYLADAPEVAQSIRDLAYARRANSYGV